MAYLSRGGAESPEAAGRGLLEAAAAEDVLAAMRLVAPGELRSADKAWERLRTAAADEGLIDPDRPLAGVDLTISGLKLQVEQLAPTVARVSILEGRAEASFEPGGLAPAMKKILGPLELSSGKAAITAADLSVEIASENLGPETVAPFLMVVERSGSWYVSPIFTAFEYAQISVLDAPKARYGADADRDAADSNRGADDPVAAVEALVEAIGDARPDRFVDMLPASEADAFRVYAPLVQRGFRGIRHAGRAYGFDVDNMTTAAQRKGSEAVVTVERAEGSFRFEGRQGTWTVDGDCLDVALDPEWNSASWRGQCLSDLYADAGLDMDSELALRFVTVRENGRWYVTMPGTLFGNSPAFEGAKLRPFLESFATSATEKSEAGIRGECLIGGRTLRTAAEAFRAQYGSYPTSQNVLVDAGILSRTIDGVWISTTGYAVTITYFGRCTGIDSQ